MSSTFRIISAGAGSGKTYRLTTEMVGLLEKGVRPSGIIATTFTRKAAAELQERVRVRLLEQGMQEAAEALTNALIGTVHGLGVKLLQRFAYEAGVSPEVSIIADEDHQILFNQALAMVLTEERVARMETYCDRLGLTDNEFFDWRSEVRRLTEVARANDFSAAAMDRSRIRSFASFAEFLGAPSGKGTADYYRELADALTEAIETIQVSEDHTKVTQSALNFLRTSKRELELRGHLRWPQLAKLSKLKPGAKSRDAVAPVQELAGAHDRLPAFREDIEGFIDQLFGLSMAAMEEYARYKQARGLIDYTDMEVLVNRLLDQEAVQAVLQEELDLLMVDEFQDTSPIQLEIFQKLSRFADYSIWVGDPKQSIYGFRGAAPELMQAIIRANGGIRPADIQEFSWRSREDLVHAVNALFVKAFSDTPPEQVALKARQLRAKEPPEMGLAFLHWHFNYDHEGASRKRQPGKPWLELCIAFQIKAMLEQGLTIQPKGSKTYRRLRAGDVAVLCRSNADCQVMAEALYRAGLKVSISRAGLLATAEARFITACLKYLLYQEDSLSVAELLLLGEGKAIEEVIEDRLEYLEGEGNERWAVAMPIIRRLDAIREMAGELSSLEILDLLLAEADLRRIIVGWGQPDRRLDNVEVLRKMAGQYEEACNRMHTAASLGGFLLWLNELATGGRDKQSAGQNPDTVNVLTYHRSKGLEWPVVVCHSLERKLRADIWGLDLCAESEVIDLNHLLGNQWLRYWVNPYDRQYQGTTLAAALEESEAAAKKRRQALEEEHRLLYVGMTRARDYLVLPTSGNETAWLNRTWHGGKDDFPTLDPETAETPWEWEGRFVPKSTTVVHHGADFPQIDLEPETLDYWPEPEGKEAYPPYQIDLRQEHFSGFFSCRTGPFTQYGQPLMVPEEDQYQAAKALKAWHTAYLPDYGPEVQRQIGQGLFDRYQLEGVLQRPDFLTAARDWFAFLERQYRPRQLLRKVPVHHHFHGRLFSTTLDLLLDLGDEWMLIQNSGFGGGQNKWRQKVNELGPWFFLVLEALADAYPGKPVRPAVHFVLSGAVMELEIQKQI